MFSLGIDGRIRGAAKPDQALETEIPAFEGVCEFAIADLKKASIKNSLL